MPLECVTEKQFSYFSNETYVVGTQKNRLNEMVLLRTQNPEEWVKHIHRCMLKAYILLLRTVFRLLSILRRCFFAVDSLLIVPTIVGFCS